MRTFRLKYILFLLLLFGVFVFVRFLSSFDLIYTQYHAIVILPFVYVISISLLLTQKRISYFQMIVALGYFVSMVFFPFLITLSDHLNLTGNMNALINYNIPNAVFIQSLSIIGVTIFILTSCKDNVETHISASILIEYRRCNRFINYLLIISFFLIILYPQFLFKYRPMIFESEEIAIQSARLDSEVRFSMPKYIYYIGGWLISTCKLILVFYTLNLIFKIRRLLVSFKLLLSFLSVFCLCFFTGSDRAATVFTGICGLLLMYRLYPHHRKMVTTISVVGTVIGIFYIFIFDSLVGESDYSGLASKINAYFSCSINVAASLLMDDTNRLLCFCGDVLRSIPLVMGFFVDLPMSYIEFNRALAYDTEYNSQILPIVGQGYFYLGYVGIILFPILLLKLGYFFYKKIQICHTIFEYFAYSIAMIYSLFGVFLYDMFLTISLLLQNFLPMYIIILLTINISNKNKTIAK